MTGIDEDAKSIKPTFAFDARMASLGLAMADALVAADQWSHRRVEGLSLMEGERGRRRVSIDCTPTAIWWTDRKRPTDATDQLLVPLSLMAKRPIRELDVRDSAGSPIPILGMDANSRVAAAVIGSVVEVFGKIILEKDRRGLWPLILRVVTAPQQEALRAANSIYRRIKLPPTARNIIDDLARNFILIAVLPAQEAGRRQVIKYSYHWAGKSPSYGPRSWRNILLAGFGLDSYLLEVDISDLEFTRSYHFECPAPGGLTVARLELPTDVSGVRPSDKSRGTVGHASGRYSEYRPGGEPAEVSLELDIGGILPRVMLGSLAAVIFFSAVVVGQLYEPLSKSVDAATAVLLTVPALLLGLNARPRENEIVSRLLGPLRVSSLMLAIALFGFAIVLVLKAGSEIASAYSGIAFLVSLWIFVPSAYGYSCLLSAERGRVRP